MLTVILAPVATKDLDALESSHCAQIVGDLKAYAASPTAGPPHAKRLRGFKPPLLRLRSGDYRILFRIIGREMHVYRILDRKNLERALKRVR